MMLSSMKLRKTPFAVAGILAAAALMSGCSSTSNVHAHKGSSSALGVVAHEKATYSKVRPTTFVFDNGDIAPQEDITGDQVTLLWGLITIPDYTDGGY